MPEYLKSIPHISKRVCVGPGKLEALKYYSGILEKVTGPRVFWKSVTGKLM